MHKHVVIQGASGGLGYEAVRQLLERSDVARIHATCRDPARAEGLRALADPRLTLHPLDLEQPAQIAEATAEIRAESPEIDLLFNTSGVLHAEGLKPERRVEDLDPVGLARMMQINALGPLLVVRHLVDALKHDRRAVVASLSARIGSIGDNRRGGWYAYRASKAALNQAFKTLSVELKRRAPKALVVLLHPGTVRTRLTEPFRRSVPEGSLFEPETSMRKLLKIIDELGPDDHGGFFDYDKKLIVW